ncbi:type VI secretion system-associated FHA domain protein TagH [Franconibacter pulveris]|uniref:type VI secretion system-associated FHA domain protein TagH n=1 Tax=Franconibacter pulveris TaxID=435910 RepID=UPI000496A417|nr:type VI secretion system-associated FHA domain protein TagH [Franconibacter pulveris]
MRFTLVSVKPGHKPPQSSCEFNAPGGTIGRGPDNHLALPDNDRLISRLQALVHVAPDGECRITNFGAAAMAINNKPLEKGEQAELQDGDRLTIAEYSIEIADFILHTQPVSRLASLGAGNEPPIKPAAPVAVENAPTSVPVEILQSLIKNYAVADNISRQLPQAAAASPEASDPARASQENSESPAIKARLRIQPQPRETAKTAGCAQGEALEGELLTALLEGLGLHDIHTVPRFDSEKMRQLGEMLSMFAQGTVALLASRSMLKRDVKADMTMMLDDANNPFKLLPSGKSVLMQAFATAMPGFMPPTKAVHDALVDLQAHQIGMISGLHATSEAMLASFDPQALEEEAMREGSLFRLALPVSRKAALWDAFVAQHSSAADGSNEVNALVREAFLQAYEREVNQYKDSQSEAETL